MQREQILSPQGIRDVEGVSPGKGRGGSIRQSWSAPSYTDPEVSEAFQPVANTVPLRQSPMLGAMEGAFTYSKTASSLDSDSLKASVNSLPISLGSYTFTSPQEAKKVMIYSSEGVKQAFQQTVTSPTAHSKTAKEPRERRQVLNTTITTPQEEIPLCDEAHPPRQQLQSKMDGGERVAAYDNDFIRQQRWHPSSATEVYYPPELTAEPSHPEFTMEEDNGHRHHDRQPDYHLSHADKSDGASLPSPPLREAGVRTLGDVARIRGLLDEGQDHKSSVLYGNRSAPFATESTSEQVQREAL